MPTEIRHIIFTPAETVEAIGLFLRARGQSLPPGRILDAYPVEGASDAAISYRLVMAPNEAPAGPGRPELNLDIGSTELVAVLIGYCGSRSIPMPVRGSKALQLFGTQVGLVITLGVRQGQGRAVSPP